MSEQHTAETTDVAWVLNRIIDENQTALNAVLLSSDGMLLAKSDSLSRDAAERTAATLAGLQNCSRALGELCGGEPNQQMPWQKSVIDMGDHTVLVFAAGPRAYIAVSVREGMASPEVGLVTIATVKAVNGLREMLSARERDSVRPA
ncbi:roadblock/LC7 domain-containing protein [Streptomyces sp. B6B3]|jgi:predicted regulator of Ras-like GTPase activity (Roadblock/LC7/MglB family)|uniref:roadblock/LC7 domain-containing protein n=1 Tax=Streptomyces sp. B6B3 TaxID=3153570 RepID=UPI00325E23FE